MSLDGPSFAWGLLAGVVVCSSLAYGWGRIHGEDNGFRRGYHAAWPSAHKAGIQEGFREAGVLDRLVALDELQQDAEFRQAAGMRRWRAAVEAWNAEGRRWA